MRMKKNKERRRRILKETKVNVNGREDRVRKVSENYGRQGMKKERMLKNMK